MKSKLVVGCVMIVACATWWTGCSSDSGSTAEPTDDSGTGEGGGAEASTSEGGAKDGGADVTADSSKVDSSNGGAFVPITYGAASCPALVPCGGDEKGLWNITGGCVTEAIFDQAKGICPTLVEKDVKFEARGSVNADGANIERKVEIKFSASFDVPVECKSANPIGTTCKAAESALKLGGLKTATCTDAAAGGGCVCDVTNELSESTQDTYTTAGNTLTSANPTRTFDYCVDGAKITYKETTADAVPAIFVLTK